MANMAAWALVFLGFAHIVFGAIKFRVPLLEALKEGFFDRFKISAERRGAFWFVLFGVLLLVLGHIAVRAVGLGDVQLLRILGVYLLIVSAIGLAAFPKSPFWGALFVSPFLICAV